MRLLLAALVLACAAIAQIAEIPGWFGASTSSGYTAALDGETRHGGSHSVTIHCASTSCQGMGGMIQTITARRYLGQRLRMSAWIKAANAGRANIWIRVEGAGAILLFDDGKRHPARGTFEWRRQQVTVDVPDFASAISYGLVLEGAGQAWVDDFTFKTAGRTDSTKLKAQPYPLKNAITLPQGARIASEPFNLDFEQALVGRVTP